MQLTPYMLSNTIQTIIEEWRRYGGRAWAELQFCNFDVNVDIYF